MKRAARGQGGGKIDVPAIAGDEVRLPEPPGLLAMRIVGHGLDLVEFESMRRLLTHAEVDFIEECFTQRERARIPEGVHRLAHISGQFAAKEAVTKALGTGFSDSVSFSDVEIGRTEAGAPVVQLRGEAAARATALGVDRWFVSISHGDTAAIASTIAVAFNDTSE